MDRKSVFGGGTRTPLNTNYRIRADPRQSATKMSLAAEARFSIAGGAPSFGYRQSMVPGATNKRVVQVPKILNIKEERNIRDKEVKQAIITKIINFLDDCVDPQPTFRYTEKSFLHTPSRNDFKNVFEFLFQCIQPNHQVNKLEEEVLKLMNNLGYPYNLKTYTMQQITVPTTWPTMLTILEWLVDIIELENTIHNNMDTKVNDGSKWQLLTSCYKRTVESKGNIQKEPLTYEREFEIYRDSQIDDDDSIDELRLETKNYDQQIKEIEATIGNEKREIVRLEQHIMDIDVDISSMKKYCEDLAIKISQVEQIMIQYAEANQGFVQQIGKLHEENTIKEQQIGAQKISGDYARQLTSERQSIREELSSLRDRMSQKEDELYRLQPKYYKQSAKVRSDYKTLLSELRSLHDSLSHTVEMKKQIAEFFGERCDFDQTFAEFRKSGIDNKLSELMAKLKEFTEQQIVGFKRSEELAESTKSNILEEIRKIEANCEQEKTMRKLDLDRAKRECHDKLGPARDLKHNLDIIKQKHMDTSEHLNKNTAKLSTLHEELAEKHKEHVNYKQQLDRLFNELQCQVLEKITRLCDRFEQIQRHKVRLMDLGNQLLKDTET